MNSIDLIKAAAFDATNKLLADNGLPPVFPANAYSEINIPALAAYQQNAGEHANAWKLLEEIGRKAEMFDELLKATKAFIGARWLTAEYHSALNDLFYLIQRAEDLK